MLRVCHMNLTQLKKNRDLLFWSLHAIGWSGYGIAQYLGALLYGKPVAYTKVIVIAAVVGFRAERAAALHLPWLWHEAARRDDRRRARAAPMSIALVWRVDHQLGLRDATSSTTGR